MAKPQRENGHIDIANTIADSLAKINLAPYESRVMWAVIRKTWGYVQRDAKGKIIYDKSGLPLKKKLDWVSVTQLQQVTGMDRRNVSKIKARLIRRRIIIKNGDKLGFNKNYDQWLSLKQTTDAIVYRDTRPKPFPPYGYRYKHPDGLFCEYCLKAFRMNKDELKEHHIIPVSQGGKDIKQNIAWVCNGCHKKIHQELRELGIVDLDDTGPLGRYYRQFMQKLSSKQTTFLSSVLTHTKEDKIKKLQKNNTTTSKKQKPNITFNFSTSKWQNITDKHKSRWVEAYPGCNIELELKQMREWVLANPDDKKKNYQRFIINWLKRSQEESKEGGKGYGKNREAHTKGAPRLEKEKDKYKNVYT